MTKKNDAAGYQQAWLQALQATLGAALGLGEAAELEAQMAPCGEDALAGVIFRFSAVPPDGGEHALAADLPACARLAQRLTGGASANEAVAELTGEGREAVAALWAGAAQAVTAATAIAFSPLDGEPPAWPAAEGAEFSFAAAGGIRFTLRSFLDPKLAASLNAPPEAELPQPAATTAAPVPIETAAPEAEPPQLAAAAPAPTKTAAPPLAPPRAATAPTSAVTAPGSAARTFGEPPEANTDAEEADDLPGLDKLGLLMDVPLDATLRFGARQMILKDILELAPGGVIELDRGVQDPVELMVAGRVVATGEVVIVDGNYGLRVGKIASPQRRLSGLF